MEWLWDMVLRPALILMFIAGIGCALISLYWQWQDYCWKYGKGKYKNDKANQRA